MVVLCTTDCVPKLECPRDSRAALREVKTVSALTSIRGAQGVLPPLDLSEATKRTGFGMLRSQETHRLSRMRNQAAGGAQIAIVALAATQQQKKRKARLAR